MLARRTASSTLRAARGAVIALVAALAPVAGCAADPCSSAGASACLVLDVRAPEGAGAVAVDVIGVAGTAGRLFAEERTPPQSGATLPVAVPLVLADGFSGALGLEVRGYLGGALVGRGTLTHTVTAGERATLAVTLALAAEVGDGGSDSAGVDGARADASPSDGAMGLDGGGDDGSDLDAGALAITQITPLRATAGATLTVDGRGFTSSQTVKVGGFAVVPTSVTATRILLTVPSLSGRHGPTTLDIADASGATAQGTFTYYPAKLAFSGPPAWPAPWYGAGLVAADFDGDGHTDVAAASANGLRAFYGDGAGGFTAGPVFNLDKGGAMATADFNGDGKADLVLVERNTINVRLATGRSFFTPIANPLGAAATAIAAGDFDGDGKADLFTVGPSGAGFFFYAGDGAGHLPGRSSGGLSGCTTNAAMAIAHGDVDNNGIDDVVATCAPNGGTASMLYVERFLGGMLSNQPTPLMGAANSITLAELDGDKNLDFAAAENGFLSTLSGHGDGSFGPAVTYGSWSYLQPAILAGDFDGDTKPDLIAALQGQIGFAPHGADGPVLTGDGGASNLVTFDANGDGRLDLVGLDQFGCIYLLVGRGGATPFGPPTDTFRAHASYDYSTGIGVGDFDGDGAMDAATTTVKGLRVDFRSGGEWVTADFPHAASMPVGDHTLATGDFDGNGKWDVALLDGAGAIDVWLSPSPLGGSPPTHSIMTGAAAGAPLHAVPSFAAKGATDLVTVGTQSIEWLVGDGKGGFAAPLSTPTSAPIVDLALGDFDGDGHADVVTASTTDVELRLATGPGQLGAALASAQPGTIASLAAGDCNGDGKADVVVGLASGDVHVFFWQGSSSAPKLASGPTQHIAGGIGRVLLGDLDLDGNLDLATAVDGTDVVVVLRGDGQGNFAPDGAYRAAAESVLALGDANGDGLLDLLATGYGQSILYNVSQ